MHTTIRLQHNFSFGLLPVIIFGLLLLVPFIVLLVNKLKRKNSVEKKEEISANNASNVPPVDIRDKYINSLILLKRDFLSEKIDQRSGYQRLSFILREYISERIGVNITNKTLAEIRGLDLGHVEELIEEFYYHEFSTEDNGNLEDSIDRTINSIRAFL